MTQLVAFTLRVLGKLDALADPGLMPQAVIAAPLSTNVVGDTLIGAPAAPVVPVEPA
jgi:hypothetical protein